MQSMNVKDPRLEQESYKKGKSVEGMRVNILNSTFKRKGSDDVLYHISKLIFDYTDADLSDILLSASAEDLIRVQPHFRKFTPRELENLAPKLEGTIINPYDLASHPIIGEKVGRKPKKTYPKFADLLPKYLANEMSAEAILEAISPSELEGATKSLETLEASRV